MPRVALKKKEYKASDLSKWLITQMYEKGFTQTQLAECIGMSQPAFSNRLRKGMFTYEQLLTLFEKLKAEDKDILKIMKV